MSDDRRKAKYHHSSREEERGMPRFTIEDPVVILTDRKFRGVVGDVRHVHFMLVELTPQSFRGQKGWVDGHIEPWPSVEIDSHKVLFRLRGGSRAALVRGFKGDDWEWPVATVQEFNRAFGRLAVRADELAHDPEPEENYYDLPTPPFPYEWWEGAIPLLVEVYWLLKARDATYAPELYVAGLREHSPQMSLEKIAESLGRVVAEWRRFEEGYYDSVSRYLRAYLHPEIFGAHVLSAVEQAEKGDSTAFTDLMKLYRVDPDKFYSSSAPSR